MSRIGHRMKFAVRKAHAAPSYKAVAMRAMANSSSIFQMSFRRLIVMGDDETS